MSTENTTPAVRENTTVTALHPITGELVTIRQATPADLADALEEMSDVLDDVHAFRAIVVNEIARRADARGARTVTLGPVTFEVNAPTEDSYDVDALEDALAPLVADGTIDRELLDELIVEPPRPAAPPPRVDKRRVNALLKSDDRRLLAALASARRRASTKRTAKVTKRAIEVDQ